MRGGSFTEISTFSNTLGFTASLTLGDFDGNGVTDLAFAGHKGGQGQNAVFLADTTSGIAPLLSFDLSTAAGAKQAFSIIDRKLNQLNEQRGIIGAFQSRLEVARNTLDVGQENFKSAESRIKDADVAEEAAIFVRLQILQNASASVLGQANQ